jgi:hypothetical protein
VAHQRLVDAVLAAAALAATLLAVVVVGAPARPPALAAGAAGALVAEFALRHHQDAVRAAWGRPAVKAAAVGAFLAALVGAVLLAPSAGLSVLAGGLVGYLALLAGTTLGDAVGR